MDRKKVFEYYSSILDEKAQDYSVFKSFLTNPSCCYYDSDADFGDLHVVCGATRAALITDDYNYVVKIDIDTDEGGDCISERELAIWKMVADSHLAQCFTEIEFLGYYVRHWNWYAFHTEEVMLDWNEDEFEKYVAEQGYEKEYVTISIPLYGCEKADTDTFHYPNSSLEVKEYVETHASPLCERCKDIAEAFIMDYGYEIYEELTDFCYESGVNDIHKGNIGYIDNKIVLLDFGGYYCN